MAKNSSNKRKAEGAAEEADNKAKVADTKPEPADAAKADSVKQRHMDRLEEVMKRVGGKGYSVERGAGDDEVDEEDDEDEEAAIYTGEGENEEEEDGNEEDEEEGDEIEEVGEEEGDEDDDEEGDDDLIMTAGNFDEYGLEDDEREYNEEEMAQFRHVIITDRREKTLDEYSEFLLGEQAEDGILAFNTSFSTEVFEKVPKEIKKILKKKTAGEKFDSLYGLTKALVNYDVWMLDYEDADALKALVKQLASAWKGLLALSDKDLEIDPEFTRPGIEALMESLVEHFAQCPEELEFEWK